MTAVASPFYRRPRLIALAVRLGGARVHAEFAPESVLKEERQLRLPVSNAITTAKEKGKPFHWIFSVPSAADGNKAHRATGSAKEISTKCERWLWFTLPVRGSGEVKQSLNCRSGLFRKRSRNKNPRENACSESFWPFMSELLAACISSAHIFTFLRWFCGPFLSRKVKIGPIWDDF